MLVEREVCHPPQPAEFAHAQICIFIFPGVESPLADTELPAEVADRGASLRLPDGIDDLRFGES